MTDARKRCEPTPTVRSGLQTPAARAPTLALSAVGREASDQRPALLGGHFGEGARVLVLCADGVIVDGNDFGIAQGGLVQRGEDKIHGRSEPAAKVVSDTERIKQILSGD